jgi:hypothetical protein
MNTFIRGLEPKVAMNIGEAYFCKKQYENNLCSKCRYAVFNWKCEGLISDPNNRNYCKKGYWGVTPDKKI